MAFDISTAKPVSGGFDLSTAKPAGGSAEGGSLDEVGDFTAAFDSTARALAQNAAVEVGAGFRGLGEFVMGGSAEDAQDAIEKFNLDFSFTPTNERSQAQLENVGEFMGNVSEAVNNSIGAGLVGLGELATGQGIKQASDTIKKIQSTKDASAFGIAGDRIIEEGGSPLAATAVSLIPTLGEAATSLKVLGGKGPTVTDAGKAIKDAPAKVIEQVQAIEVPKIQLPQSARKQEIGRLLLEDGDGAIPRDVSTVGFDLVNPPEPPMQRPVVPVNAVDESGINYPVEGQAIEDLTDFVDAAPNAVDEIADIIDNDRFRVKNNKFDKAAQSAGYGNGIISFMKGANRATKDKALEMTDKRQAARKVDDLTTERPSDVVGESVLKRVEFLQDVKKKAGKQVGLEADNLANVNVDYTQALDNFTASLKKEQVKFSQDGIDFRNSTFSDHKPSQTAINNTYKRLSGILTGKDLHNSKIWLDETMDLGKIGKTDKPISDRVQRKLLRLRTDINGTLRDASPGYKRANVAFSDTITAIDDFDKSMGHAIDVTNIDEFTKAGVGTKLRAVFSNQAGRGNMSRALGGLDETVKKYGGQFDDNVIILNQLATELDNRFGNIAPQSFGGQVQRSIEAVDRPLATAINKISKTVDDKIFTEDKAFDAMRNLLNQ